MRLAFTNLLPIYNHLFILLAQPSIEDLHILNRQVVFKWSNVLLNKDTYFFITKYYQKKINIASALQYCNYYIKNESSILGSLKR